MKRKLRDNLQTLFFGQNNSPLITFEKEKMPTPTDIINRNTLRINLKTKLKMLDKKLKRRKAHKLTKKRLRSRSELIGRKCIVMDDLVEALNVRNI